MARMARLRSGTARCYLPTNGARWLPTRSTTSPRLVGATPAPPACESARSTQEVHSHHMPSPDTDWSCWSKASEIPQSNLTYSIRLQRNSGPAHYPLQRTGCLPRGLPLVSPMRLVVVRTPALVPPRPPRLHRILHRLDRTSLRLAPSFTRSP